MCRKNAGKTFSSDLRKPCLKTGESLSSPTKIDLVHEKITYYFPEVVFCNLVTDMFSGSDVVYYGSGEWGDGKFWNFLEQDVSALVSRLPERLLTHMSSSGSMEAVVSNKFFSFSDLVGSNSFTDIFF